MKPGPAMLVDCRDAIGIVKALPLAVGQQVLDEAVSAGGVVQGRSQHHFHCHHIVHMCERKHLGNAACSLVWCRH